MTQSELLTELSKPQSQETLFAALKQLKNAVIGHVEQKDAYLDHETVPLLLQVLMSPSPAECRLQAAQILCSFAHGTFVSVGKLLKYPILTSLIDLLRSNNEATALTTTCLKTLVTILKKRLDCVGVVGDEQLCEMISKILVDKSSSLGAVEQCCRLIPLLSVSIINESELPTCLAPKVASLLNVYVKTHQHGRETEHAIGALAHVLTKQQARGLLDNGVKLSNFGGIHMTGEEFLKTLVTLTRDDAVSMRLAIIDLLSKLQCWTRTELQRSIVVDPILPTILPLFGMLTEDPRVSLSLARICRDDEKVAAMAAEFDAIKNILGTMKKVTQMVDWQYSEIIADMFQALAGMAIHEDKYRNDIVNNGGLQLITQAMNLQPIPELLPAHYVRTIKRAVCRLLRSLSRSVQLLRTGLNCEEVANGAIELLNEQPSSQNSEDDLIEMKSEVMAAVCNLVLDFSPLSGPLMEKGIMECIYQGCVSSNDGYRLNSLWALKHAIFNAHCDFKRKVLLKLGPNFIVQICQDRELACQEQAMDFLRNLVCGSEFIIDKILSDLGHEKLFRLLDEKLEPNSIYYSYPSIIQSAAYTLVHIASGSEQHRNWIIEHESVLHKLLKLMNHQTPEVRTAVVWLVINLTWIEHHSDVVRGEQCRQRASKLVSLGFERELEACRRDPVLDVRERTKTALNQMEKLVRLGNSASPSEPSSSQF